MMNHPQSCPGRLKDMTGYDSASARPSNHRLNLTRIEWLDHTPKDACRGGRGMAGRRLVSHGFTDNQRLQLTCSIPIFPL
jgi:hypothetical protein